MKKIISMLFSVPFLFIQACTTDVGYEPDTDYSNKEASYKINTLFDLPYCTKNLESLVVHSEWEESDFVCSDGYWVKLRNNDDGEKLDRLPETFFVDDDDNGSGGNKSGLKYKISSMMDSRDGKLYNIVTIGSQTWMAENLAYKTTYAYETSILYNYDFENGLFYDWEDAISGGEDNGDVCPDGWHLPSKSEWEALINYIGGRESAYILKSKDFWEIENDITQGTDGVGFSAFPAGYKEGAQNYLQERTRLAAFWTSDGYEDGSNYAYAAMLASYSEKITLPTERIYSSLNVRCVKD